MKKSKTTAAEKNVKFIESVKIAFCEMYDWTEERYTQNEFDVGLKWIKNNKYPNGTEYSRTFWNWWKLTVAKKLDKVMADHHEDTNMSIYRPTEYVYKKILSEVKSIQPEMQF